MLRTSRSDRYRIILFLFLIALCIPATSMADSAPDPAEVRRFITESGTATRLRELSGKISSIGKDNVLPPDVRKVVSTWYGDAFRYEDMMNDVERYYVEHLTSRQMKAIERWYWSPRVNSLLARLRDLNKVQEGDNLADVRLYAQQHKDDQDFSLRCRLASTMIDRTNLMTAVIDMQKKFFVTVMPTIATLEGGSPDDPEVVRKAKEAGDVLEKTMLKLRPLFVVAAAYSLRDEPIETLKRYVHLVGSNTAQLHFTTSMAALEYASGKGFERVAKNMRENPPPKNLGKGDDKKPRSGIEYKQENPKLIDSTISIDPTLK